MRNQNYETYKAEISNRKEGYLIPHNEFIAWLKEGHMKEFKRTLQLVALADPDDPDDWNVFDIAVDYEIPVIMVKWFIKNF